METVNGYILLSRLIEKSDIYKQNSLYLKIWIYLLVKASYKNTDLFNRGQLFVSISDIQESCYYLSGFRKVKPTYWEVWNIMKWLENNNMIKLKNTARGYRIDIIKYDIYQNPEHYEKSADGVQTKFIANGYIKLAKNIINSEIFHKPNVYFKAWLYFLILAKHSDTAELKAGEFYYDLNKIKTVCSYFEGKKMIKPLKQEIERLLRWMQSPDINMITAIKRENKTIIKINNYEKYQEKKPHGVQHGVQNSSPPNDGISDYNTTNYNHDPNELKNIHQSSTKTESYGVQHGVQHGVQNSSPPNDGISDYNTTNYNHDPNELKNIHQSSTKAPAKTKYKNDNKNVQLNNNINNNINKKKTKNK
jgi:hypothetical protein